MPHDQFAQTVISAIGLTVVIVAAFVDAAVSNVDPQDVVGWVFGALGTGGVLYKVWTDRTATTRADKVVEEAFEEMKADRDFWRARALGRPGEPE